MGIFFDQISRMTKIFNINALHIKPMTSMTAEYSISADFTAATYIYREGGVILRRRQRPRGRPVGRRLQVMTA